MRLDNNSLRNNYINSTFAHESPLLQQVRLKGEEVLAGMQISPHEGKLLAMLAKMVGAKNILEIGTFVGYSTLWLAGALPEDGHITTIEARAEQADIAHFHFVQSPYAQQITLLKGKALDILPTLNSQYDLIFIDAAKAEYYNYVIICEPILRHNGLFLLDNSLLFGNVYGEASKKSSHSAIESVRAANSYLANTEKYCSMLLQTEEGLTIALKL
jgi:predicted O-methyltransferase YrrM